MKKHNKGNINMVLIGIIVPIFVFFIAVNVTYAYFTARPLPLEGATSTGLVTLKLTDDTVTKLNSTTVSGSSTMALPGDTLSISGTIENIGTTHFYALFEFEILITKSGETTPETALYSYYTIIDNKLAKIVVTEDENGNLLYSSEISNADGSVSTHEASAFCVESANEDRTNVFTKDFEVSFVFDGTKYDNTYKNASVSYTLNITAIQKDAIETSTDATKLIVTYYKHKRCANSTTTTYIDCDICNPQPSSGE